MSAAMQPVRAVLATLAGGVAGGLALGAVVGYGAEALGEPDASGLEALLYALFGVVAGATLGATAAVAAVFQHTDRPGVRVTALTVLAAGLLWGLLWVVEPGLFFAGVVLLPVGALLGRWFATRSRAR